MNARTLVLLGLGELPAGSDAIREAAIRLGRLAGEQRLKRVAVLLDPSLSDSVILGPATSVPKPGGGGSDPSRSAIAGTARFSVPAAEAVRLFAEGFLLGAYRWTTYARDAGPCHQAEAVTLRIVGLPEEPAGPERLAEAIRLGRITAESVNYARDLTNLPGNMLTPQDLAEAGRRLAAQYGLPCEVLDETRLRELGMGGLLAVGQGSVNPPRLLVLRYQGLDAWGNATALIGKGVTFDTGGISLKPGERMEEMISDMGGAAVLLAVMRAAAERKPKANLLCVIGAAENMPSGGAYKPGDVITTMSGRTVEVRNTDAEGRIVMADAMTYAIRLGGIARVADVATLTGNVLVALGDVATMALCSDEAFWRETERSALAAGEKLWRFPIYEEYREMLKSDFADLNNSPGKWAGGITAGLFAGAFAEGLPWLHLDTGGTAWLWHEGRTEPKWATGAMTRTLIELLIRDQDLPPG